MTRDPLRHLREAYTAARERGESLSLWLERYPAHARDLIDLEMDLELGPPSTEDVARAEQALRDAFRQVTGHELRKPKRGH